MVGSGIAASAPRQNLETFQASWVHRALQLQNQLNLDVPLSRALIPHTHNSYNAQAYQDLTRYVDPNQVESVASQLAIGFRSLEFDVHYTVKADGWPWQWEKELLLCHGQGNHLGCGIRDRRFAEGLQEIASFLNNSKNKDEVLILYIEDHMDDRYDLALKAIKETIGNYVYRPRQPGCQGIPMNMTLRDVLRAGKQILLMGGREVCGSNAGWDRWAFGGVGNYLSGSYPTASIDDYQDGDCERAYSRADYRRQWIRVQEDRTKLTKIVGKKGTYLSPDNIRQLVQCGVNLVGFDKARPGDPRLQSLIWSWAPGHPRGPRVKGACAEHGADGRFYQQSCDQWRPFACRNEQGEWYVTTVAGPWAEGAATCETETGGVFTFASPWNGFDSHQLQELKQSLEDDRVWLNYRQNPGNQRWIVSQ
jgi:hypothetical protein